MRPSIAAIAICAAHLRDARAVCCLGHYHCPSLKQSKVVSGTFGVTSEAVHEGVRVDLQRPVAQLKFTASTSGQPISARLVLVKPDLHGVPLLLDEHHDLVQGGELLKVVTIAVRAALVCSHVCRGKIVGHV